MVVGFSPVALSFLEKEKENCSTNQVYHILLDGCSKTQGEWVVAGNLKMLAKSGLGFCHGVQCWKEKTGKKLLDKMEVPWSKNKGRKSGVMRALERL